MIIKQGLGEVLPARAKVSRVADQPLGPTENAF